MFFVTHIGESIYAKINTEFKIPYEFYKSEYKRCLDKWLSRPVFEGHTINTEIVSEIAIKTFRETGVWLPYELFLSQCQIESGMGRFGRSAKNNPLNIGEWDSGTRIVFQNQEEGICAYYCLISKNYEIIDLEKLLKNGFRNKKGFRYASNPDYEKKIICIINKIKNH